MGKSRIDGLDDWIKFVKGLPEELQTKVKNYTQKTAFKMEAEMKQLAPVDTGHLRRNINVSMNLQDKGLTATLGSGTIDYASHIEFGTSKRSATPYFFPIVYKYKPRFINTIKRYLREIGD